MTKAMADLLQDIVWLIHDAVDADDEWYRDRLQARCTDTLKRISELEDES